MEGINEIYVYENWKSDTPSLIGTLYVDGERGKQVASFEYDDEWLNDLMKRREAIIAKKEERKPRTLTEIDFLIGVYDETRMGGLRFSTSKGGVFQSDDKDLATPPWTTLRKLESASLAFEKTMMVWKKNG